MELTNYWMLIVWVLVVGFILDQALQKEEVSVNGTIKYRWSWDAICVLVIPYVLWAGYRSINFSDTYAYKQMFIETPANLSELSDYFVKNSKDKGFSVLISLIKMLIGDNFRLFFLIIAAIQMFCIVYIFRKFSTSIWMSIFFFIASADYIGWMYNGIRQFLAVTIIFASYQLIIKKKYIPLVLLILLLSTIHATALIFLPFIFIVQGKAWNKKTMMFVLAVLCVVAFLDNFTNVLLTVMENSQYKDGVYEYNMDDGVNVLRVLFYSVPTILALIFRKEIAKENSSIINMCTNFSIVSTGFYIIGMFTSGIFVGRIPIYFSMANYILLPWILNKCFVGKSRSWISIVFIVFYVIYFYTQMHFMWGLI